MSTGVGADADTFDAGGSSMQVDAGAVDKPYKTWLRFGCSYSKRNNLKILPMLIDLKLLHLKAYLGTLVCCFKMINSFI